MLDGARKERQEPPESPLAHAKALKKRGVYLPPFEAAVRSGLVVEERVDRRVGPARRDFGEGPLGSAHHEEVVVYEADRRVSHDPGMERGAKNGDFGRSRLACR